MSDKETISDVVFYIYDTDDMCVARNSFAGSGSYDLEFPKDGVYSVYALCNISEYVDLPVAPERDILEAVILTHREHYDRLPLIGQTVIHIISGKTHANTNTKIKLRHINSSIRIENRSTDRMRLSRVTVSGLPDRGAIIPDDTLTVRYTATAEAEIDADGNATVYCFPVPEEDMPNVKIEVEAEVFSDGGDRTVATTVSPVAFVDRLKTGEQATALVGYLESGNIKIGSPSNWGNVGSCEFSDGVRLQVVGGEFFDYKNIKALRAYSGGSEFSCIVESADGVAAMRPVSAFADWVVIRDNIMTVLPNDTRAERECQISVSIGGNNVGTFYIVQGREIRFTGPDGTVIDNDILEIVGGSGGEEVTVSFDIDGEELDGLDILPGDMPAGISVSVDREAGKLTCGFIPLIDASEMDAGGVSVPVDFVDINGTVQATLTLRQRPAKIALAPVKYSTVSHKGGTVTATVTVEGDADWSVHKIENPDGTSADWLPVPEGETGSGGNLVLEVEPNDDNSGRTAYVYLLGGNTLSKPYEITQTPFYGIGNLSADLCWDTSDATLRAYSKGRGYAFTFETATAIPEGTRLVVDCDPDGLGSHGIAAGEITNISGNTYGFILTVPDSDNPDEEETACIDITADGMAIGRFTVVKAFAPSFVSVAEEVWGGVKDRPELRKAVYRASEWDVESITSDNLKVETEYHGEMTIFYAEELMYDSAPVEATVTMNLKGGNKISCRTRQAPVEFIISDADLRKLKDVGKERTEVEVTVDTRAGASSSPWRVNSLRGIGYSSNFISSKPTLSGGEVNAGGAKLTIIFSANKSGNRTGYFTLKSRNTTSQMFEVSQKHGIETVSIGGVQWTLYNLEYPKTYNGGTLATALPSELTGMRLTSLGRLYQWGYNTAWKSETAQSGWSDHEPSNSRWESTYILDSLWINTPCPVGFRIPTADEFEALLNACNITRSDEDTWGDSKIGYVTFTDKTDSSKRLEFPAINNRNGNGSMHQLQGHYWSSQWNTANDDFSAKNLYINGPGMDYDFKLCGMGVRCVLE